jgi:hypothetical protein
MPYPPKPPTTQAVGAALKRAGFSRSQSSGVYVRTAGYTVRKCRTQPDAVDVRWWPDSRETAAPAVDTAQITKRRTLTLLRYADALLVAGFRQQLSLSGDRLTVYARRG